MLYFIPDEGLWEQLKATLKPVKKRVKHDLPKRLRVVRGAPKAPKTILDLHGLTVQEAFESSQKFIAQARKSSLKEITVITGRGTTGKALIKNEFEGWLENPKFKPHIRAHQWQNKGGAVKIALKRK
ncbi:MAG: Smr/MutS family protein [Alphaproteobacteria bacterium]|nr:Smr/MutS family protein [Alphaproteobacteria bacterium]